MTAAFTVTPSQQACGAEITDLDLSSELSDKTVRAIRDAWLEHHVLAFPNQSLSDDDLERFALRFGDYGNDTFFGPIPGRKHIAAIRREAEDTNPIFAETWHTDWSFQAEPPAATFLYGIDIPPVGGNTLFANQHLALEQMPDGLRRKLEGLTAIHSAVYGYAPDGPFQGDGKGSMDIRPSEKAYETQPHELIRPHPETSRLGIFGSSYVYVIGFEGLSQEEAKPLLDELSAWQTRDEFIYEHRWQPNMLVMWDNRSVLHRATGGYEGHRRELHRITINSPQAA